MSAAVWVVPVVGFVTLLHYVTVITMYCGSMVCHSVLLLVMLLLFCLSIMHALLDSIPHQGARQAYTRSVAVISIVGYMVGLGPFVEGFEILYSLCRCHQSCL